MRRLTLARLLALAAIALMTPGAGSAPHAADRMLDGKRPGRPLACLPPGGSYPSSVAADGALLFRASAKLVYRNDMQGCRVGADDIIVTRLYGSGQACRGDIARLVDRASRFPHGSCAYGDFVPWRTAQ